MNILKNSALVLVAGLFLVGCHQETEQDKIKKVITAIQKAAEKKEIRTILGHLSKSYRDPQGYDYDGIKGLLLVYFYRHQKVSVYIPSLDVAVAENSAHALFQTVLTGGNQPESVKDLLPESLGVYTFDVTLMKESGAWIVTSAKWERAGEGSTGAVQ